MRIAEPAGAELRSRDDRYLAPEERRVPLHRERIGCPAAVRRLPRQDVEHLPVDARPEADGEEEEESEEAAPSEWHDAIEPYHADNDPFLRCPSDPSPVEFFEMSYTVNASFVAGLRESAMAYPSSTILAADRRNTLRNQDQAALFAWWQWQGKVWPPAVEPEQPPMKPR